MDRSDIELWKDTRTGSSSSFGLLFDRHADAIYNFCFRRCGQWDVAEDLTSVVFLEAWRRRSVELDGDSVLAWLYGIATNVVRSQHRSLRRHRAALARLPGTSSTEDHADEVVARRDDEVRMQEVLAAMSRMSPKEQDVFVLVAWEQLSYEETAAALRIPTGTVQSRLSRARMRLREILDESGHSSLKSIDLKTKEEHS